MTIVKKQLKFALVIFGYQICGTRNVAFWKIRGIGAVFNFGYHSLISLPTMRADHLTVFLDVADRYKCMIGLREPNALADRWIGKEGYAPKSVNIKSKTADRPDHPLAGLVVDPGLCPEAFKEASLPRVRSNWSVPTGGMVTTDGKEKGLLRVYGKAIHADYDLMVISPMEDEFGSREVSRDVDLTKPKSRAYKRDVHLYRKVATAINTRLVVRMIQHGSEFMYDGLGAKEEERIFWFAPNRRHWLGLSSMPEKGH